MKNNLLINTNLCIFVSITDIGEKIKILRI